MRERYNHWGCNCLGFGYVFIYVTRGQKIADDRSVPLVLLCTLTCKQLALHACVVAIINYSSTADV